ncbi:hypothetical protein KL86DPRO_70156 [uncultured delta proteobacterium]|uniref:L,D-TPase catalytic domain-containing protein n=1 Tax=uncultured delta proteobacterium TaxID=34034 RepID=A0A212KHI2_9DELT|nr:hypothetical protein KL86DPRO_70156 [uncultured delta proteobacterium]
MFGWECEEKYKHCRNKQTTIHAATPPCGVLASARSIAYYRGMKRNRVLLFAFGLAASLAVLYGVTRPGWDVANLAAAREHDRLLVVLPEKAEKAKATLRAFAKKDGTWREVFTAGGFVGYAGIATAKKEGDGATPQGAFTLRRAFGTAENPGTRLPYTAIDAGDVWVDDPASRHYNTMVKRDAPGKDWGTAEDLAQETTAYKYAVVIEYNTAPVVNGAGSAIFLHCAVGRPTAGCVSVAEADMVRLLRFLEPGDAIVIAASPADLRAMYAPDDK